MKKHLMTFAAALLALASCSQKETVPTLVDDGPDTFYAYSREAVSGDETRTTYTNQLVWTPGDELTIYTGSDANKRFVLVEGEYDTHARFSRADDDFYSAKVALEANYAVYPYSPTTQISSEGVIYYELPQAQKYASYRGGRLGTIVPGSYPMVAVTENRKDQDLFFKNLCGILVFNLTGTDRIRKIDVKGNDGELMCGYMTVTSGPTRSADPIIEMYDQNASWQKHTTLWVTEGSEGYLDTETPTEFWVAIPSGTYAKGITVTFFNELGQYMTKSLDEEVIIHRNGIQPMGTLEFIPEGGLPFEDPAFAEWCASNLDTNGDWILSAEEIAAVRQLRVYSDQVRSLKGIEAFPNLTYLLYDGYTAENELGESYATGLLTGVDISYNTKLDTLIIRNSQLFQTFVGNNHPQLSYLGITGSMRMTALDVSGCTMLSKLYCYDNQWLETLNVENTPNLLVISASRTSITSLTTGPALSSLFIDQANLTSLDVTASEALGGLYAQFYHGNTLDLSHNPKLMNLDLFSSDNLTTLDLSANTLLYELNCERCPGLSELNLSNHRWLDNLQVRESGITHVALANQPLQFLYSEGTTFSYAAPSAPALVDLGLPSGLKWATSNLGATDPIQAGYFYRWGTTVPAKPGDDYSWTKYILDDAVAASNGYPVDGISTLLPADDAVAVALGGSWHTPTAAEWTELIENCDWSWSRQYDSVNGRLFLEDGWLGTSRINGATIFFPAVGYYNSTRQYSAISYLWTADLASTSLARAVAGNEQRSPFLTSAVRTFGLPIRPVHD